MSVGTMFFKESIVFALETFTPNQIQLSEFKCLKYLTHFQFLFWINFEVNKCQVLLQKRLTTTRQRLTVFFWRIPPIVRCIMFEVFASQTFGLTGSKRQPDQTMSAKSKIILCHEANSNQVKLNLQQKLSVSFVWWTGLIYILNA